MRKSKSARSAIIAVLILAIILVGALIYMSQNNFSIYDMSQYSWDKESDVGDYEYNSDIINMLLIGIDSEGTMETSTTYGDQARADNIDLISINTKEKTVKVLPVSRDTMTDVMNYSTRGYEAGKVKIQLGFAFSFGNGGYESSMNVCDAVSDLLIGIPVPYFITTNLDSIAYANNLIGGVTVTVPNNDLSHKYSNMKKGNEVKLTKSNVADFLRYRGSEDGSNNGRMERQQAFIEAYIQKLETMSKDDFEDMWDRMDSDKSKIKTNLDEQMFISLIGGLKEYAYNPRYDNLHIEGKNKVEDGYDVFYPDKERLRELVIKTYYRAI